MKNVPFPLAAAARYVNVKFATQQKKNYDSISWILYEIYFGNRLFLNASSQY